LQKRPNLSPNAFNPPNKINLLVYMSLAIFRKKHYEEFDNILSSTSGLGYYTCPIKTWSNEHELNDRLDNIRAIDTGIYVQLLMSDVNFTVCNQSNAVLFKNNITSIAVSGMRNSMFCYIVYENETYSAHVFTCVDNKQASYLMKQCTAVFKSASSKNNLSRQRDQFSC
jgi:hypothetical protein